MIRKMKDSGSVHIGMIPTDWRIAPIKYYSSIFCGSFVIKTLQDDDYQYPVFNGGMGNTGNYLKFNYKGDLILVSSRGASAGYTYYYQGKCWIGNSCYAIKTINNIVDWRYLYYSLKNNEDSLNIERQITTIPAVSQDQMRNSKIALPNKIQQQAIVVFLDAKCAEIDALTADIQSEIETLEAYKRSKVFEVVGHGLGHIEFVETDSDVWKTIPQGWEIVDVKYLFEIVKRIAGKEGYDIIAITQQGLKFKDISSNEGQLASNYSGYQFVYPGDYAMNHMDLLTGWVDLSDKFGVTSPDYRVFRLRYPNEFDKKYYKYIMQCCYMCRIFYSLGQGVSNLGRWRLQTSEFNDFKVPVPPYDEQVRIGDFLDEEIKKINSVIAQKQKQLSILSDYKKSIIYEYVTGKKEVPCHE